MGTVAVEREKLYRQVWSIPGSQLAVLYGISDVGLAKACKRYHIPRPPRGYWARRAAGNKLHRPPLPKVDNALRIVRLKGWDMPDEAVQQVISNKRPSDGSPAGPKLPEGPPHALVTAARSLLSRAKPDHEGLVETPAATALHIKVSPAVTERCLSVMDALIKRWELRGGKVIIGATIGGRLATAFAIGDDSFGIQVVEAQNEKKPLTDPSRLMGRLILNVTGDDRRQFRRRWADTATQRLERMLNPLIETLLTALAAKKAERLDAECVARQRERVNARQKASNSDASREFYWRQELMEHVSRWHDAERVRAYLAALKAAVDQGRWQPAHEERFATWFGWASAFADSIDPIVNRRMADQAPDAPQNTPAASLDLTSGTRSLIDRLGVPDSDALWRLKEGELMAACTSKFGAVWNEITRVLMGLGYDVSKRREMYDWM